MAATPRGRASIDNQDMFKPIDGRLAHTRGQR
jgi:hypothetical protein